MKRPSFQFYPGDWMTDLGLRMCSAGARGLWVDMLCLMHQGSTYGYLEVNLKPILPANLANLGGCSEGDVVVWLDELERNGVFSRDERGCIFSRRMLRDEKVRAARAAGGSLGGNPQLIHRQEGSPEVGDKVNLRANLRPTPSSSSSSSINTPPTPKGVVSRFADFWEAWPASSRKVARAECEKRWKTRKLDEHADAILQHVEGLKGTDTWQRGFEPAPLTFLNQRRWEDGAAPAQQQESFV